MGALIATSHLPAIASEHGNSDTSDLGETFAGRGRFARLSLSYSIVRIGLPKPFSILHISDTHLTAAYPDEPEEKKQLQIKYIAVYGGLQEQALRDSKARRARQVLRVIEVLRV